MASSHTVTIFKDKNIVYSETSIMDSFPGTEYKGAAARASVFNQSSRD